MIAIAAVNTQRLEAQALEVFPDNEKAARWIREPNPALANKRPIDMVETEEGYQTVCDVLTRIESGTYS
ncbi:MAG: DUF2384 domain-containing protein [Bryobacterales bacterium]|nr:DUF2384 domain-containing protein [Bryobacterales bacterium]